MKKIITLSLFVFTLHFAFAQFATTAEKSQWKKTGSGEEAQKLCLAFQKKYPEQVDCKIYGKTAEKRDLYFMRVGDQRTPAVWVQAGIHAGEIDGKDAVFLLIKEILEKKIENPLQGIHLIFVPIVNLDGHERFGKWNRPNQVGPEEMGWRVTAQNINMNRDFMKIDSPEMDGLLKLWHEVDPVLSLDLHVTDGAQFQPEVGLVVQPNIYQGSGSLNSAGKNFETTLLEKMKAANHLALPFYPSFEEYENPLSGVAREVSSPRFAHGYWFNSNRLAMLVETHSWKDYATRVKTHHDTVFASLQIAQKEAKTWKKAAKEFDENNLAEKKVELTFKHTKKSTMIDFPGYKFSIEKSAISGGMVTKYFPDKKENWKMPFYGELESTLTVDAPESGYLVQPSDAGWLIPKLKTHGIKFEKWNGKKNTELKVFRASKTKFSPNSYEGHQTLKVEGEWRVENVSLPKAMIFIPINQPMGRVILQLFEPKAEDSFVFWGFFNRAFERKEYMEDYVTEDVAIEMLKDKKVKAEFEDKLKTDSEFAKDPDRRFEFFYRKHSSWDDHYNRYPVFKK